MCTLPGDEKGGGHVSTGAMGAGPQSRLPEDERKARVALSRVGEPGGAGIAEIVAAHGAVEALERPGSSEGSDSPYMSPR